MTFTRYDFINVKAEISAEGWIKDRPVITRSGIFEYRTSTGKTKRECRPDTEVFKDDSLSTISGIPITDGHIGLLSAKNHRGVIGAVISPGIKEDNNVLADIIIHDATKLGDRRDLSLGYVCDLDETPGVTENGERYDAIQKNIKYNHLAVVISGRAGNARLRLDSTDAVNGLFDQEKDMSDTPKLTVIKFDNLEYVGSPEVANRLSKYEVDLVELKSNYDAMEAERDTLKASLEEEKQKIVEATKSALAAARARIKLEDAATKAGVKLDEKDKDRDIKIGVIQKLRGDILKFDGKSDEYVDSAYDLIIAELDNKDDKLGNQRRQLNERKDEAPAKNSSMAARERM